MNAWDGLAGARDNEPLILNTIDEVSTWRESHVGGGLTPEIRRIRFADAVHGWELAQEPYFTRMTEAARGARSSTATPAFG